MTLRTAIPAAFRSDVESAPTRRAIRRLSSVKSCNRITRYRPIRRSCRRRVAWTRGEP